MQVKNGEKYANNYARAAAYMLGTCAKRPGEASRAAAYDLITGMYALVAKDVMSLGFSPVDDVYFDPWEKQKGREKDVKLIRDPIKKLEEMAAELFKIAESMEREAQGAYFAAGAKAGRALKHALAALGVTLSAADGGIRLTLDDSLASGLMELARISRANASATHGGVMNDKPLLYFSRAVFEPKENWEAQAFDRLLDAKGELLFLVSELEKRGYERIDCFDGVKVGLDYVKRHGKKDEPLKIAWGERVHSGISLTYEELRLEPAFLWIRMPMYKTVLANQVKLPRKVLEFAALWTKSCDGCRYCVQTDKTGERPLAAFDINGTLKCPLYPGFSMNWRVLDRELAENIVALLDAIDALGELA